MTQFDVADTELKAKHRTLWGRGDYPRMVDTFLTPIGERLVEAAGITPGQRVLDVAAGTGNASVPAARLGARVTASDLTPELLQAGARRPDAAGLDLEWVEADAEHLPFDDASYDVVLSAIGVMFAPHHQVAADELARVCRPGGTIALLSWTPPGMLGDLFATMKPFAAPPRLERSPRRCGGARSTSPGCSVSASPSPPCRAAPWRSPRSGVPATTESTSRPTTDQPSPYAPTPPRTAARRTSTRRSTGSARSGISARRIRRASRWSTSSPSGRGPERTAAAPPLVTGDRAGDTRSMAEVPRSEALLDGARSLERAQWSAARDAFRAALEADDRPEAHDGLGQALWFLGCIAESITERELAFEGYVATGRCDDAARAAVWVSHQHLVAGRSSAARGWLARAERSLERAATSCPGRAWVAVERARQPDSSEEQADHAGRAMQLARTWGIRDIEVLSLSLLGRAIVSSGRREEGLRLLEEAMAAAPSGQVRSVHTLAEAYCALSEGCATAGEWDRAGQWCELVDDFARTSEAAMLLGACRTVHADVLLAIGRWPQAEHALEAAVATHAQYVPAMGASAVAALAELRVQQGRLPDAAVLLRGREEEPSALRALALLRLAEARPAEAAALLERGLRETADHAVRTSRLLAALVDARLDTGEVDAAAASADALSELGSTTGLRLVQAHAELAVARVALARDRHSDAAEPARRALRAYTLLAMPFGAAEARLALAAALAVDAPALARDEARTALGTFHELGAARGVDAAAGLLRRLDVGTAPRPRIPGQLTAHEREVLQLVALGLSNAWIAEVLVISEKTAGHHVSSILGKLGVRNRTEAAAHAPRAPSVT